MSADPLCPRAEAAPAIETGADTEHQPDRAPAPDSVGDSCVCRRDVEGAIADLIAPKKTLVLDPELNAFEKSTRIVD